MKRYEVIVADRPTVEAYRALFQGRGGLEDARRVLADLEAVSGFRMVTAADATMEETKFSEGARSVFARIHVLTTIADAALDLMDHAEKTAKEPVE